MRLLVTAGNTHTPIDQVRVITNIFTGRTGAAIAVEAWRRGHQVTLLTSHPEALAELHPPAEDARWSLHPYRTFDDLASALPHALAQQSYHAVVHVAAVSDYQLSGVYVIDPTSGQWRDVHAPKIPSSYPELWLRLTPTPKLIDRIRRQWHFRGLLVKFKLEVACPESELLQVAEQSRQQSQADLMVANTLEQLQQWAWLGPWQGKYLRVCRSELPARLCQTLELLNSQRPCSDSSEPSTGIA
jgi:phosphopantothenate-cysteine ligase/phosphopantothenoylcysteine decarboxylase/phosphopantothenate--cysteine ligase